MQLALENGDISAGHARALLSIVNPADREYLYKKIIDLGLSVREAEKKASELNKGGRAGTQKKTARSDQRPAELVQMEEQFLETLGTRVNIRGNMKKGKIEINYYSMDDLERIYEILAREKQETSKF